MQKDIYNPTKPFNEQIRRIIESTHPEEGPIVLEPHGKRYKVIRDYVFWENFDELTGTDGIGTKGKLHWEMETLPYGVQDVFAMVMDDLMEGGYVPVILQDHILIQEENEEKIFSLTGALRDLCVQNPWKLDGQSNPIIISGGETAIINTIQGFEMGITATGYVNESEEIIPRVEEGDFIIGLGSSGIHSNGLSFLREELFDKRHMELSDVFPWGTSLGEELTKPTHIYMPATKELIKDFRADISGIVHITGGGLSKLREFLPSEKNLDIKVYRDHSLRPQEIFHYTFYELGCSSEKMYTRFNNGVGYVVAIEKSKAKDALRILRKYFPAEIIGDVVQGEGKVIIESQYDNKDLIY